MIVLSKEPRFYLRILCKIFQLHFFVKLWVGVGANIFDMYSSNPPTGGGWVHARTDI